MTMSTPCVPGSTGALAPRRSPGDGVAEPEFEIRASTITLPAVDRRAAGDIAIESSRVKLFGSEPALSFSTARGIRGPSTARANMYSVSAGATRSFSAGPRLTRPVMALAARSACEGADAEGVGAEGADAEVAEAGGAAGVLPACAAFASAIIWLTSFSGSLPGWDGVLGSPQSAFAAA